MSKKSKWLAVARIGAAIASAIVPGAAIIEQKAEALATATGESKKAALLSLVASTVAATEGATSKDLLNDPEILRLTGALSDAYIALQNGLAAKRPQ